MALESAMTRRVGLKPPRVSAGDSDEIKGGGGDDFVNGGAVNLFGGAES